MTISNIEKAIKVFNLKAEEIFDVQESNSSEVRIVKLISGDKVVIKIPWSNKKFHRERNALSKLSHLHFIPNLLDSYESIEFSALLLEYLDGMPISSPDLLNRSMAFEIGQMMASMHLVTMPDFEGFNNWKQHLRSKISANLKVCTKHNPNRELAILEENYISLVNEIPEASPCLIHYDFRLGNLLANEKKILGLIDFESARGGAADMDFFKIWNQVWNKYPELKGPTLEGYKSIKEMNVNLEKVLPIYSLYHGIAGMAWCILRGKPDDPFYNQNLEILKEGFKLLNIK